MESWRLLINEPLAGPMNMAIDEAVLTMVAKGSVPPTIRFYQWSAPTMTLGYFQSYAKEVDIEICNSQEIDLVRRLTGGRAVLHHGEFTYSLAVPEVNRKVSGSILRSYLAISQGLLKGLKELGVKAELSEGKKSKEHLSAACFDAPSWYELVVDGKKLVGSAQTRKYSAILQHGSIPIEAHPELLFKCLNFTNDKVRERAKKIFLTKATTLYESLGFKPEFQTICTAFKKGMEQGLELKLEEDTLTGEEKALAEKLYFEKYSTKEWNRRR